MGGKGSGGSRVGAGRKPKDQAANWIAGRTRAPRTGAPKPRASALPVIPPPAGLADEQQEVWTELAPLAAEQRTLTPATASAFRDLVEAIVLHRWMLAQITNDGLTSGRAIHDDEGEVVAVSKTAHPLLTHLRGMMQRVEAGKLRFRLLANGKELSPAEEPEDEFGEFDAPSTVN